MEPIRVIFMLILNIFIDMSCSGVPDLKFKVCCDRHDFDYAIGGSEWDRLVSDTRFLLCMRKQGSRFVYLVYYSGVYFFGWLFWRYGGKLSIYERIKAWLTN